MTEHEHPTADPAVRPEIRVAKAGKSRPERQRWVAWRRLQFSLRTLMVLMVLAGVGVSWWLRPQPEERVLPGGLKLRSTLLVENEVSYRHGRWEVVDKHGRVLCRGRYQKDIPTGMWSYYHPNGRLAARGEATEGVRSGEWTYWWPNGRQQAVVRYGKSLSTAPAKFTGELVAANREGACKLWWENGQLRAAGEYQRDQRHGPWTLHHSSVALAGKGSFRMGRRHGPWSLRSDAQAPAERVVFYINGVDVGSPSTVEPRIRSAVTEMMKSNRPAPAVEFLTSLGALEVEALAGGLEAERAVTRRAVAVALSQLAVEARGSERLVRGYFERSRQSDEFGDAALALLAVTPGLQIEPFAELAKWADRQTPQTRNDSMERVLQIRELQLATLDTAAHSESAAVRHFACDCLYTMLVYPFSFGEEDEPLRNQRRVVEIFEKLRSSENAEVADTAQLILEDWERRQVRGAAGFF